MWWRWKLAQRWAQKTESRFLCRRHPPSKYRRIRDDLRLCNLHLQRVLPSHLPRPGLGSGLASHLLHALLNPRGWAQWSIINVLDQVFWCRGTQWTSLCFRLEGVDHVNVIDRSLGLLCCSLARDCGLYFIQLGSVVAIPWGICDHGKQVSLPVVLAMAQNAPVRLHFVEILISKLLWCIAPCLWGLPSLKCSYPNQPGEESDFGDCHARDRCPIHLLYVICRCTSRIVDFGRSRVLSCSVVGIPLLPGPELHEGKIRTWERGQHLMVCLGVCGQCIQVWVIGVWPFGTHGDCGTKLVVGVEEFLK